MSTSRRSFFKLVAAAPFAAPEIARAARAELDNMRWRAMFGEIKPLKVGIEVETSDLDRIRSWIDQANKAAQCAAEYQARNAFGQQSTDPLGDQPVIDQMRDHDIFDLEVLA